MVNFVAENWQWVIPSLALIVTVVGWFAVPILSRKLGAHSAAKGGSDMESRRNIARRIRGGDAGEGAFRAAEEGGGGKGGDAYGIWMDEESAGSAVMADNVFEDIQGGRGGAGGPKGKAGRGGDAAAIRVGKRSKRAG